MGARRTLSRDNALDKQHSAARTLVLHLLPGTLLLAFFVAVAPVVVRGFGFPPVMAIYLTIVFVLIPFELGYLVYQARMKGTSLGTIVLYRQPVPKRQFVLLVGALFVWAIIIGGLLTPLDIFVKEYLFSWLPGWFVITNGLTENLARYSTAALLITWAFGLIVNGLVAPVVEEMYFRGYLLPRISHLGAWAPLVNTVLFSLYHFFTPWLNVGRIIQFLPVVYAAWWKRSIYVSIAVHVLGNVTTSVVTLLLILGI